MVVNGIDDVDELTNAPSFLPSVEGIQEFKLLVGNYPAEFGRRPGAQVAVITKGGGNDFHGDIFEFIRNQVTDGKNYFSPHGIQPPFKRNQFGMTLGGPILRGRTFFFINYEGLGLRQGLSPVGTVPTPAMISGDFRGLPGVTVVNPQTGLNFTTPNVIDPNLINPIGKLIAQNYPNPTTATPSNTLPSNNYVLNDTLRETMNEWSARVDHTLTSRDSLFLNYNLFNEPSYQPYNNQCGSVVIPGFGCDQDYTTQLAAVGETHTFSPSLINDLRFGGNRLHLRRYPGSSRLAFYDLFNNNLPLQAVTGLNTSAVTGYASLGSGPTVPSERYDTTSQISDSLTFLHGHHTIKVGFDFIATRPTQVNTGTGSSSLTFSASSTQETSGYAFADILLGLPTTVTRSSNPGSIHQSITNYDFFAQDDWQVTPYFTLNAGLRYELNTPFSDRDNHYSTFDPATGGYRIAGVNGVGSYLTDWDLNNLAPRIGFSYQPFHNSNTVIRAGYGVFYQSAITLTVGLQNLFSQYPFSTTQSFNASTTNPISLNNPFPGTSATTSTTATGIAPNIRTPYVNQWSLGVQRALTSHMVLEATYVGSTATKLPLTININQPAPGSGTAPVVNARRPYPKFGNVTWIEAEGNSSYQGLLVKVQQTFGSDLNFLAAYTYGHSIDDTPGLIAGGDSSSGLPQNSYDLEAERGRSDFDIKNSLVLSPVYTLPFGRGKRFLNQNRFATILAGGWQFAGIFTLQTGRPFTPYYSTNNSNTYENSDRPNMIRNPNHGPKTVKEWFDTAAFTNAGDPAAGIYEFGNTRRNAIDGPGLVNLDAVLSRTFPVHENVNLQFRAESFNLANHPNFLNPTGPYGTSTFGTITAANDPRELQFALKVLF